MTPGANLRHGADGKRLAAALPTPRQGRRVGRTPGLPLTREPLAEIDTGASGALAHFGSVTE